MKYGSFGTKEKVSLTLILSTAAFIGFSQPPTPEDYRLFSFENDTYRDFTFKELAKSIGQDAAFLPVFKCDGKKEMNLFAPAFRTNPSKNSLRVKGSDSDEVYTYINGEYFDSNGKKRKPRRDTFLSAVAPALEKIESLSSGKTLLRQLEQAPYVVTIERGLPRFQPTEPNGKPGHALYMASAMMFFKTLRKADDSLPFSHIGAGGSVRWLPELNSSFLEADGVKRVPPAYIALGHELFHSFDGVRGILDRRQVEGLKYEFTEVVEYRGVWFENQIRRESGLKFRKYYGAESGADLLNYAGQPIVIPTVCLTEIPLTP